MSKEIDDLKKKLEDTEFRYRQAQADAQGFMQLYHDEIAKTKGLEEELRVYRDLSDSIFKIADIWFARQQSTKLPPIKNWTINGKPLKTNP